MKRKVATALEMHGLLIQCGPAKIQATTWGFTSTPKNIEELRLGNLLFVGEVDTENEDDATSVLPLVGANLKQEYYAHSHRKALSSFGEALKASNTTFARVPKKRNPMWLGRVHVVAACFSDTMLHFTLVGKVRAYLFRGDISLDLGRRFVTEGRPHPTKLFRNVASGALEKGDRLLFAPPRIFTSLFLEDLRHIVRESPLEDVSRQIETLYKSQDAQGSFHLIVAEVTDQSAVPPAPEKQVGGLAMPLPGASAKYPRAVLAATPAYAPLHLPRSSFVDRRRLDEMRERTAHFQRRIVAFQMTARLKKFARALEMLVSKITGFLRTIYPPIQRYALLGLDGIRDYGSLRITVVALGAIVIVLLLLFRREVIL